MEFRKWKVEGIDFRTGQSVVVRVPNAVTGCASLGAMHCARGVVARWRGETWAPGISGIQAYWLGNVDPTLYKEVVVTLGNWNGLIVYHRVKMQGRELPRVAMERATQIAKEVKKTRTGTAFWLVAKCCHRRGSTFGADQSKAAVRNSCGIKASPSPPGLLSPRRGEEG